MKKLLLTALLFVAITLLPLITMAAVDVRVRVPLPPPIPFVAPPPLVVLPGTDIYAVPDVGEDIFFRGGWWWRRWDGRWYRSRYHDRGWAFFPGRPEWYGRVPHDWRDNYRNHVWEGHPWHYRPIPHRDLDRHWREERWRHDRVWDHPGGPDRGPRDRDRGPRDRDRDRRDRDRGPR